MTKRLGIGWRLDAALMPPCDVRPEEMPSSTKRSFLKTHLYSLEPSQMMTHSLVVAQSRSGKSFFLGRVVEELVLATRGRALVLDPNGDFLRITDVNDDIWSDSGYDSGAQRGFIHTERQASFSTQWKRISKDVRTPRIASSGGGESPLEVPWFGVSPGLLGPKDDSERELRIQQSHRAATIHAVIEAIASPTDGRNQLDAFRQFIDGLAGRQEIERELATRFPPDSLAKNLASQKMKARSIKAKYSGVYEGLAQVEARNLLRELGLLLRHLGPLEVREYLVLATRYLTSGIFTTASPKASSSASSRQLEVIDLLTIRDAEERLLVAAATIDAEFQRLRAEKNEAMFLAESDDLRTPTFLVIDEAHNLIPRDCEGSRSLVIRDLIRSIAAEGRKFGLFLLLVTQRPDKIDGQVASECENLAVMRMKSNESLNDAAGLFGLDAAGRNAIEACRGFPKGRALLFGPWGGATPITILAAPRRTVQGGRDFPANWY